MRSRHVVIAAMSAVLLAIPVPASAANTANVNIVNFAFQNATDSSSTTNIAVGDSIEWDWAAADGITPHSTTSNATSGPEVWDSGQLTQPSTYSHGPFNTAGVYAYHCTVHASMHGTIVVGDVFEFTASTASVIEGDTAHLMVQRLGAGTGAASVQWHTSSGSASAGIDYVGGAATLNWADGETGSKSIDVGTIDDGGTDIGDKDFTVDLSTPSAGGALGTPASVTVTIHEPLYQPDALVKGPADSSYRGGNRYNTLTGQTSLAKVKKGKSATFRVQVQNDGNVPDTYAIRGKASTSSFSIRYLRGITNITKAVVAGSERTTSLAPGKSWIMNVVIAPKAAATVGALIKDIVSTHSMTDTTKKDAVLLEVKVIAS